MNAVQQFLCVFTVLAAIGAPKIWAADDRPLQHSDYNPDAATVDLFDGLNAGTVSAKVVAKGAAGGHLFLTNHAAEPLTVKLPEGFVAVPVHSQFNNGFPGGGFPFGPNGGGNANTGAANAVAGTTGTQAVGMGANGANSTANGVGVNGANNGIPAGFFSIPAARTLRVAYTSVCLNYGLHEPTSRTAMKLVPVEEYTTNPALRELVCSIRTGTTPQRSLQAAAWHVANGVSWEDLANKGTSPVRIPGDNYFSSQQMRQARELVTKLEEAFPAAHVADQGRTRTLPAVAR